MAIDPAPFFLTSYVAGGTFDQARVPELPARIREAIVREAGENLAELHMLGPLSKVGDIVYEDGEVRILDSATAPSDEDFHDWMLDSYEESFDQIEEHCGYFADLTEDPTRLPDLVPDVRQSL